MLYIALYVSYPARVRAGKLGGIGIQYPYAVYELSEFLSVCQRAAVKLQQCMLMNRSFAEFQRVCNVGMLEKIASPHQAISPRFITNQPE